ncbi:MAG: hypothetical protein HY671_02705 [Chloroflexi bacterium]|nr:hypothetical protein [Chloroflexota bacterium]
MNSDHHKLLEIKRDLEIWLGDVSSPRIPGKKIKVTDPLLDLAESAHVYFLQPRLNERKRVNPADRPITVYNRWWHKDFDTPFERVPYEDWPDVIDFLGARYPAKLIWFGGPQIVREVSAFKK